jgi:hypothetical protein
MAHANGTKPLLSHFGLTIADCRFHKIKGGSSEKEVGAGDFRFWIFDFGFSIAD